MFPMTPDDASVLDTPPDPGGPCHAASLPPVWRAAMAPRGDLLSVRPCGYRDGPTPQEILEQQKHTG